MKAIIAILFSFLLASCCTKVHRADINFPQLNVKLIGFTEEVSADKCLYTFDARTGTLVDSVNFYQYEISPINLSYPVDQYYVIRAGPRQDTIRNISYECYAEKIGCNKCFPAGGEEATVTNFRNLRYDLNGVTVMGKEDVVITR
jgi:hypothetical protein